MPMPFTRPTSSVVSESRPSSGGAEPGSRYVFFGTIVFSCDEWPEEKVTGRVDATSAAH